MPNCATLRRRSCLVLSALAVLLPVSESVAVDEAVVPRPAATIVNPAPRQVPLRPLVMRVTAAGGAQALRDLGRPRAVDVAADGRWLVVDKAANRVVVFGPGDGDRKVLEVALPEDADFLPGGGYLITSGGEKAVIELDESGARVWEYAGLERPLDADRLAGGNTLITDARPPRVIEVDPSKKVVWSHAEGILFPWDAERAPDGSTLIADYNRHQVACVRPDGSTCWRLNHIGHPSAVQILDDGSVLVAAHKSGWLLWFDARRRGIGSWRLGEELNDFAFAKNHGLITAQMLRGDGAFPERKRESLGRHVLRQLRAGAPAGGDEGGGVEVAAAVETAKKNLVILLFDSLRIDHVPWHGYWRETAPRLHQLARRGLVFDQYITQAPWTKPSVASLLTSTHPSTHGATSQKPQSQLPVSLETIAETLWANGYFTVAVMENPHMGDRNSSKGFEQGYEIYRYVGGPRTDDKRPRLTVSEAVDILGKRPPDQPFFLTVFFMNPHYPYAPHQQRFGDKGSGPSNPGPINDYDSEIWEADEQVGRLLDFLAGSGHADDTIVVFSSDHGEEFGDHGKRFHGDTLYDCVISVPLVVAGLDRVGRFPGLVREIDLMPTLLDYLGIEVERPLAAQMAGVSVRRFLEPGVDATGLIAHSQSRFRDNTHLVSERSESRKVIADLEAGTAMIFDLTVDPQEYDDLATAETSAAELARLAAWESELEIAEPDAGPTEVIPEEVLERLRAAGYLGD
jgi:arylsulfatase A-like enzyme